MDCQGHRCYNEAAGLPVALYSLGDWNYVFPLAKPKKMDELSEGDAGLLFTSSDAAFVFDV